VSRVLSLISRRVVGRVRISTDDPLIRLDFRLNLHETPTPRDQARRPNATRTHSADPHR
jgi:hypothetical protein